MKITELNLIKNKQELKSLPLGKLLINTINAHSFNIAKNDIAFSEALTQGNILIPDGIGIVWAFRLLKRVKVDKIAGADLFDYEMSHLNNQGGKCFFMGSTDLVLQAIKERVEREFPNIEVVTYSPPYKSVFSKEDNHQMIEAINNCNPDLLWIGMTAPKQEKWGYENFNKLKVNGHIGCIGAVFDFYAGNIKRAPSWMINSGLEWFYRLLIEPRRMWRRYLLGNIRFIGNVIFEYLAI